MAGFLDLCIFSVLFRILTVAVSGLIGLSIINLPSLMPFITAVAWFFYLWLFEWLAGWTIGKRIVKLKVVDSQLGMRPKPSQTAYSHGCFCSRVRIDQAASSCSVGAARKPVKQFCSYH